MWFSVSALVIEVAAEASSGSAASTLTAALEKRQFSSNVQFVEIYKYLFATSKGRLYKGE